MNSKLPILLVLLLVGFCCCLGVVCALSGGLAAVGIILPGSTVQEPAFQITEEYIRPTPLVSRTAAPTRVLPTADPDAAAPGAPVVVDPEPATSAEESLLALKDTIVPINDPRDLAMRFLGIDNIPETLDPPAAFPEVGDQRQFFVQNAVTNQNFEVTASLRYLGDNVYFWIQDGVSYRAADLERLGRTFDQEIYPTTRAYFGSEWNPGIDNDPRLYILYASDLGTRIAGYFSSNDSVHPLAHKFSNGNEMFLLNADTVALGDQFAYSVLAHEFQHMIHWYQDRNESSWLNEGFSELAAFLNGYGGGGFELAYTSDPDIQLNDWPNQPDGTTPHYGASFLYMTYFLDRFGDEASQALVSHPDNSLESVDAVLSDLGYLDLITGQPVTTDDVFSDWAVANYLRDPNVADGRYTYYNYQNGPRTSDTESINSCPQDWQDRSVKQYGVDYISIECSGTFTLNFEGEEEVGIVPMDPYSGDFAYWSNKGDESHSTLTQTFDFRDVSGPLTLSYWVWYDIEKDYDYVYLTASKDGENWEILQTPRGTDADPSGNSYGWGYNGESSGWVQESVDISRFAGEQVELSFEYITDAAVNGEGMLIDDVSIPQIDHFTDFETGDGGWEADGFVRIQNRLPQTYAISLIQMDGTTAVETFHVAAGESLQLPIYSGDVVLVVSGTTRFTRQPAEYRFSLSD